MLILRKLYNLQITQLGLTSYEWCRNVKKCKFVNLLNDLLNENDIDSLT